MQQSSTIVNNKDENSFTKDWAAPLLGFIGVIVGGFVTLFANMVKEKPFNSRIKQMVSYELKTYKTFLYENIFGKDINKTNKKSQIIVLSPFENKNLKLEFKLNDLLISNYGKMSFEQKVSIFDDVASIELQRTYEDFQSYITRLKQNLYDDPYFIKADKEETIHILKRIQQAIDLLNPSQ